MCIIGRQYFVSKVLQTMILDEKCPPQTPSCTSYNIVGIFESSKQHLKTWY
jgi:hypothetical protein